MSFLRIGTICVVMNDNKEVLLSRRGDIGTWSLPGGRLDLGETLSDATVREVREETGLQVDIENPIGLYFMQRWARLNVLFAAKAIGGELKSSTNETLDNRFFALDNLPDDLYHKPHIEDAHAGKSIMRTIDISDHDYNRLRRQFALRWVKNLMSGTPEPRFPRFDVQAVGLMWDPQHIGVLNNGGQLPRVKCDGVSAPWLQLAKRFAPNIGFLN